MIVKSHSMTEAEESISDRVESQIARIHQTVDEHCLKQQMIRNFHQYTEDQLLRLVVCELNDGLGESIDVNHEWLSEGKFKTLCHVLQGLQKIG